MKETLVKDIDGNSYKTVKIGEQIWMAENLKVNHYNNGDKIPTGYNDSEWEKLFTGAFAVYPADNDNASQKTCGDNCADVYGNLYNWYAVDDKRGLAPNGWHIPTDDEIKVLEIYLGMSQKKADDEGYRGTNEVSKLAGRADLWESGALVKTPEFGTSGFDFLPSGNRSYLSGNYGNIGDGGYFWSSTEFNGSTAWCRLLYYSSSDFNRYDEIKKAGFSVRCIMD